MGEKGWGGWAALQLRRTQLDGGGQFNVTGQRLCRSCSSKETGRRYDTVERQ